MKPAIFKSACWAAYGLLAAGLGYCLVMPALTVLYIENFLFLDLPMAEVLRLWVKYLPWALVAGAMGIIVLQRLAALSRKIGEDKLDPQGFFVKPRSLLLEKPGKKWQKTIVGKK